MSRRLCWVAVASVSAGIVVLAVISMLWSRSLIVDAKNAFAIERQIHRFESRLCQHASNIRVYALVAGYDPTTGLDYVDKMRDELAAEKVAFGRLKQQFKHHNGRRTSGRKPWERYETAIQNLIDFHEVFLDGAFFVSPFAGTFLDFFENSTVALYSETTNDFWNTRVRAVRRVDSKLAQVSEESGELSFRLSIAFIAASLVLVAIVGILAVRIQIRSCARVAAHEKLLHQQAHEMRNKYGPALFFIEKFLETADGPNPRVSSFLLMRDDMNTALVLLREVEKQHQARLDVYRILRKTYVTHLETFDIISFMAQRISAEGAIARAQGDASSSSFVEFVARVPAAYSDCSEIHVRTDMYLLNHVMQNLLGNSRKHTYSGQVSITFLGQRDDCLNFGVRDTGTGIPPKVVAGLFKKEMATGDNRGTGLGAGGGYCRLKETQQQDEARGISAGFTEFEFGLKGDIVRRDSYDYSAENKSDDSFAIVSIAGRRQQAPAEDPAHSTSSAGGEDSPGRGLPLPLTNQTMVSYLTVIICDDSDLNRRCILRILESIAGPELEWRYVQFETAEAMQPVIRSAVDTSRFLICLDENMESRGGTMKGIDAIRWLKTTMNYQGWIVSTSGDPSAGEAHLNLGADLVWGKPLPKTADIRADLERIFARPSAGQLSVGVTVNSDD